MNCSIKRQFEYKLESVGAISPGTNLITNLNLFEGYRTALSERLKSDFGIDSDILTVHRDTDGKMYFTFNENTINEINQKSKSTDGMETNFNVKAAATHKSSIKLDVNLDMIKDYKEQIMRSALDELTRVRTQLKNPDVKLDKELYHSLVERSSSLEQMVYGVPGSNTHIGLRREIVNLSEESYRVKATVEEFYQSDLAQVKELVKSDNYNDIKRAREIIQFWKAVGTFDVNQRHPLFDNKDLYAGSDTKDSKGQLIPPGTVMLRKQERSFFESIGRKMRTLENALDIKEKEALESTIGGIRQLNDIPPAEITYDALFYAVTGLKDITVIDKYLMDPSNGIFDSNGLVPQIAMIHLQEKMEENASYSKKFSARMSAIQSKAEEFLLKTKDPREPDKKINKHNMYDMFYARNATGQRTDNLVQQYSRHYIETLSAQTREVNRAYTEFQRTSHLSIGDRRRQLALRAYNKATKVYNNFVRENTEVMNPLFVLGKDFFVDPDTGKVKDAYKHTGAEEMIAFLEQHAPDNTETIKELVGERQFEKLKQEMKDNLQAFEVRMDSLRIQSRQKMEDEIASSVGIKSKYSQQEEAQIKAIRQKYLENFVQSFVAESPLHYATSLVSRDNAVTIEGLRYIVGDKFSTKVPKSELTMSDPDGNKYTQDSGYYDEAYKHIATNQEALELLELMDEGLTTVFNNLDPDARKKLVGASTIPQLEKGIMDILMDPNVSILTRISRAIQELYHQIRESFGKKLRPNISHLRRDVITGETNYKVDDSWLRSNKKEVDQRMLDIELDVRAMLNLNETDTIPKYIDLTQHPALYAYFKDKLGLPQSATNTDVYNHLKGSHDVLDMPVMKILRSTQLNDVMMEQSLDLPKIMKLHVDAAMLYKARNEALPFIEMVKKHYQRIKSQKVTDDNEVITDKDGNKINDGLRTNANEQFENWFQMRVLGDVGSKNEFSTGEKAQAKLDDDGNYYDVNGDRYYTEPDKYKIVRGDQKRLRNRIDAELDKIKDARNKVKNKAEEEVLASRAKKLIAKRNEINSIEFSVTAIIDNLLKFLRFKALGYNISSSMTNLWEGQVSNSLVAFSGKYFKPVHIHRANRIASQAMLKATTAGKVVTPEAKKLRILMDRFDILQDMTDELQKSNTVSAAHKFTSKLHPFELTQRVEYLNQTPLLIAKMLDTEIKGKDGAVTNLWDAFDENGMLLEEYATDENKKNWEEVKDTDYYDFKIKVSKMIVNTHGDYSKVRGSLHKRYMTGKGVGMFKGWLYRYVYANLGAEQLDIETGTVDKGRLRSATVSTGLIYGMLGGMLLAGPFSILTGISIAMGVGFTSFFEGNRNLKGDISLLQDLLTTAKDAFHTMYRLPINIMTMGKVQLEDKITNRFENEVDQQNYRAVLANIALLSTMIIFKMLVAGLLAGAGDDDEDENGFTLGMRNLLMNKLVQFSDQAAMYASPTGNPISTFAQPAPLMWINDMYNYLDGWVKDGEHDPRAFNKAFLPAPAKPGLGLGSWVDRQFKPDWTDDINPTGTMMQKKEKEQSKEIGEKLDKKYGKGTAEAKAAKSILRAEETKMKKRGVSTKERLKRAMDLAENMPESKIKKKVKDSEKRAKAQAKKDAKESRRKYIE